MKFLRRRAFSSVLAILPLLASMLADVSVCEAQQLIKRTSPAVDLKRARIASPKATPRVLRAPLADTFKLHSRRSATKTIYLDFDGHETTGTFWNSESVKKITTAPYSFEGDASFSDNELAQIQEIWERVQECFSPFDVNVTTEAPPTEDLIKSGGEDTRWGIRVLIGVSTPDPAPSAGGVAFLTSFNWNTDTPTFVFSQRLGNDAKNITDATVHEVGHTLGLDHDGRNSPSEGYYTGHGSGPTGWAPHMGVGYYQQLVQWSKGEYLSASNSEDDLAIITTDNGFGYRPDDATNTQGAAANINGTVTSGILNISQKGVIEKSTDVDWYKITAGTGALAVYAVGGPFNTMLDIKMELFNSSGVLLESSNPANDVKASINRSISTGTYYLKIEGVGKGDPLGEGYSDYGSLGQYFLTGTCASSQGSGNVVANYSTAAKTLYVTGDAKANGVYITLSPDSKNLVVTGANGTKINNKTTPATFPYLTAGKIGVTLGDGEDSITISGVGIDVVEIKLGNGNDSATLNKCTFNKLAVDGGTGTDSLVTSIDSLFKNKVVKAVP